jgi:putative endonuclease
MFYVYVMASKTGTLYVGMTNDLARRVAEHKQDINEGFTKKYKCHALVYYEYGESSIGAIEREKQIKKCNRMKKSLLISRFNPTWVDLSENIVS